MDILRPKTEAKPETPPTTEPAAQPQPQPKITPLAPGFGREVVTTLGPDTEFEGTLKFKHTLRIEGKFKGNITTEGHVTVTETGNVQAEVRAGAMTIAGKVVGNITADDLVDLQSTADMRGDIKSSKLRIEEGVVFVGHTDVMPKEHRDSLKK